MKMDNKMKQEVESQLHDGMELSKGVYLGDIDNLMKSVETQMPVVQDEQIYLWELQKQIRIYISMMAIATLIILLGVLI